MVKQRSVAVGHVGGENISERQTRKIGIEISSTEASCNESGQVNGDPQDRAIFLERGPIAFDLLPRCAVHTAPNRNRPVTGMRMFANSHHIYRFPCPLSGR